MASERSIKKVLDLVTVAPVSSVESLDTDASTHRRSLMQKIKSKNVVGIGISEKTTKGKPTGKLALTFYVEKKIPLDKLKKNQLIPPEVSGALAGNSTMLTDIVELGTIKPGANATKNPVQPGFSIGHIHVSAGTLGAIVTDGKDQYILSNSHILANSGKGKKGDPVIYPARADGGKNPADLVGHLHAFEPFVTGGSMVNFVDCAIAKPIEGKLAQITAAIKDIGFPKGIIKAKRGMHVVKVGRTTGKTESVVKDVHFRFLLTYEDGVGDVGYIDQVLCDTFTDGGDSGSLVIDKESGCAISLHFAFAPAGSVSNPIDKVLKTLGVTLVTQDKKKPTAAVKAKRSKKNSEEKKEIMITEKLANLAREKHTDFLMNLGVHAISVDERENIGEKTFGVTAYVEQQTDKLPSCLKIKSGKKIIEVPLTVKVAEKFKV